MTENHFIRSDVQLLNKLEWNVSRKLGNVWDFAQVDTRNPAVSVK